MYSAYTVEVNFKKNYDFQLILLTFLFRAPRCCRKILLKSLWSCALAWYFQKHQLTTHTHTHIILPQHLTNKHLFSSHLTCSEKLHQRQFVRLNCWTLDPWTFFSFQCHHMSLMDFVVSPPGCGQSVTDFRGWDSHEA
jgi:hypothetical protein